MSYSESKDKWRKTYYNQVMDTFVSFRHDAYPACITLPCSSVGCMFELGGSSVDRGVALLIASPSGHPTSGSGLHRRRSNGLHATVKVWPGSLVAVAVHDKGKSSAAVYRVERVAVPDSTTEGADGNTRDLIYRRMDTDFGNVTLRRQCVSSGISKTTTEEQRILGEPINRWDMVYDVGHKLKDSAITQLMSAVWDKLYMYNCEDPSYIEPFNRVSPPVASCIRDTVIDLLPTAPMTYECSKFKEWHNMILRTANCAYVDGYDFVYVLFNYTHSPANGVMRDAIIGSAVLYVARDKSLCDICMYRSFKWVYTFELTEVHNCIDADSYLSQHYDNSYYKTLFNETRIFKLPRLIDATDKKEINCLRKYVYCTLKYTPNNETRAGAVPVAVAEKDLETPQPASDV